MLDRTCFDKSNFNHQLLRFRTQYYLSETAELIARHKLLTVFVLCLLAPGLKNIQVIGIPFYALIDPSISFKAKVICLITLLFFLLSLTQAQSSFIKGGKFSEYLSMEFVPLRTQKAIDFIILLFSLNLVWIAIFFGGMSILPHKADYLFITSQYCLYVSTVGVLCIVLWSFLYKNIVWGVSAFAALLVMIFISKQASSLFNFIAGISAILLCGLIFKETQYSFHEQKSSFKMPHLAVGNNFFSWPSFLKSKFIIQWAVIRRNKGSFLIRLTFCSVLSLLILQVLNSPEVVDNQQGVLLALSGMQIYLLSTLFIFFEKEKLEHALFHRIFPYQCLFQPIQEGILILFGLLLVLIPIFLFCIFSFKDYLLLMCIIFLMNSIVLAINRSLYAFSLRFCLFSSLLNTGAACVVQSFF